MGVNRENGECAIVFVLWSVLGHVDLEEAACFVAVNRSSRDVDVSVLSHVVDLGGDELRYISVFGIDSAGKLTYVDDIAYDMNDVGEL